MIVIFAFISLALIQRGSGDQTSSRRMLRADPAAVSDKRCKNTASGL